MRKITILILLLTGCAQITNAPQSEPPITFPAIFTGSGDQYTPDGTLIQGHHIEETWKILQLDSTVSCKEYRSISGVIFDSTYYSGYATKDDTLYYATGFGYLHFNVGKTTLKIYSESIVSKDTIFWIESCFRH